jgi:hypothetical protein
MALSRKSRRWRHGDNEPRILVVYPRLLAADAICVDAVARVHHLEARLSPGTVNSQCELVIRPNRLPAVVEQLRKTGGDGAWAVFMFRTTVPSTETTDDYLNLQYSIERRTVGLDWVLLGPRNYADKEALTNFIRRRRHKVEIREMNDVAYLRVEDGNVVELGLAISSVPTFSRWGRITS